MATDHCDTNEHGREELARRDEVLELLEHAYFDGDIAWMNHLRAEAEVRGWLPIPVGAYLVTGASAECEEVPF